MRPTHVAFALLAAAAAASGIGQLISSQHIEGTEPPQRAPTASARPAPAAAAVPPVAPRPSKSATWEELFAKHGSPPGALLPLRTTPVLEMGRAYALIVDFLGVGENAILVGSPGVPHGILEFPGGMGDMPAAKGDMAWMLGTFTGYRMITTAFGTKGYPVYTALGVSFLREPPDQTRSFYCFEGEPQPGVGTASAHPAPAPSAAPVAPAAAPPPARLLLQRLLVEGLLLHPCTS